MMRRALCCAVMLLCLGSMATHAQDAAWPQRPIRLVVCYPPGGLTDVAARLLSTWLQQQLGQPAVVENRAGATGTIGTAEVAKAAPDGHTLLVTIGSHTIVPALMRNLPYDTLNDLAPISLLLSVPNLVVVRQDAPYATLADLVAAARAAPGQLSYSTAGYGTTTHLMMAMLEHAAGLQFTHAPFRGSAASMEALLAGNVTMSANLTNVVLPMLQEGRLRALAVVGPRRSAALPQVPTFAEAGFPAVRGDSWIGLLAPARTPAPIIARLAQLSQAMLQQPETRQRLLSQGVEPLGLGPAEFDAQLRAEVAAFDAIARAINLSMQ